VLAAAIKHAAQNATAPVTLVVSQTDWFQTLAIDYHDGLRYPHLERIANTPDMLASIAAPHAK